MTPLLLKRPQPSRNSVSPLVESAEPNLEPRLTHHVGLLHRPAGGWRRFGGPPPAGCGGWWDQIGDRTRRPGRIVPRYGCLRSGLNSRLSTPLRRLSRPPSLPSGIERHLPHLAHALLRRAGDHQRLVDPRLELIQRRNSASRNHPVVSDVSLRPLDAGNLRSRKAENPPSG
jgi:hypothetical protein